MLWPSLLALSVAGVFVEAISRIAATAVFATGLAASALRAFAILRGSAAEQVEWMTAVGFAVGVALSALIFALDLVFG
jgi:hypothetical protein